MGCGGISDHQPVLLQVANNDIRPRSPFKFNATWLENDALVSLLKGSWKVFDVNSGLSSTTQFAANLKIIKEVSITWSINKKEQDNKDLVDIEVLLVAYVHSLGFGFFTVEDKVSLTDLESKKRKILCE